MTSSEITDELPVLTDGPGDPMSQVPLPQVATDHPAAVLVVDVQTSQVLHANALARQLAPDLALPVDLDAWATLAGLRDPRGRPLGDTDLPLSELLAQSPPVARTVTASRASDETAAREGLYAVGIPLEGAPGFDRHALVALLPLRNHDAVGEAERATARLVRDRALLATACSFTLADARLPDQPLVWVNPAFTTTTGYAAAEVLGNNCRFLQGPDTDLAEVTRLREAIAAAEDVTVVLLNYRKDGSAFWNQISVTPVLDHDDQVSHYVGIQTDVTERVEVERSLHVAYERERAARSDAEQARRVAEQLRDRITLVAEATDVLASTLDVDEALERLRRLAVPMLADMAVVTLVDDAGRPTKVAGRHRDGHDEVVARWCDLQMRAIAPHSATERALRTRKPVLVPDLDPQAYLPRAVRPEHLGEAGSIFAVLGLSSALVVPLVARQRVVGVLALLAGHNGQAFSENDIATTADLGRRAGLAIDNARLYAAEHAAALTLQSSLLPVRPELAGLQIASAYLPSNQQAEVGGDWWDAFALQDGATGIAIGDVMGHDIAAAAAMGQLRSVLRTSAWLGQRPRDVLDTMDNLVQQFEMAQLATALYARLTPATRAAPASLTWSNAGHLPPVLLPPDGPASILHGDVGVPIGAPSGVARIEQTCPLVAGSTLLLYTDGLVETREHDIDHDIDNLLARVGSHDADDHPQVLVDALTSALDPLTDDVALLALKVL